MSTTVKTSQNIINEDIQGFLDTLLIQEIKDITLANPTGTSTSNPVALKDTRNKDPLRVIAFIIFDQGSEDERWEPLPYFEMQTALEGTTSSFFPESFTDINTAKDEIDIGMISQNTNDQIFKVYLLKEKVG